MKIIGVLGLVVIIFCWPLEEGGLGASFGLTGPEDLKKELINRQVIVLDGRAEAGYLKGHIPGALNLSWEKFTHSDPEGVKYRLVSPRKLAKVLGEMGISEKSTIVAYGDADSSWGGEGWVLWVLNYLGHKGMLLLLNGGIRAWVKEGFPLNSGRETACRPTEYHLRLRPESNCDTRWIEDHLGKINVIDTRSLPEYLAGRLPGTIHIRWKNFLKKDGSIRSKSEILALLKTKGVDLDRTTVYYCTGGIRSGFAYNIHEIFDLGPARNFEGGTEEWFKRSRTSR